MNNKKTIIACSLLLALVLFCFCPIFESFNKSASNEIPASEYIDNDFSLPAPINAARCAAVIDAESGNMLYSKNADEARGMASTTKIMTALVAIENGDIEQEFTIPKEAIGIEGSSVYLQEGEKLTLRELLYCLLLESGNDSAVAIALAISKSTEEFVGLMNSRAEELGLKSTHFTNPHGLSDKNHKTTARELAIITAEAMKYPLFCEIAATKSISVRYNGTENGRRLVNHNKLLFNYEYATGGKTGYTKLDGKCLVSSASKDGMNVICVTLQDAFPPATHQSLLDFAFASCEYISLAKPNSINTEIAVNGSEQTHLRLTNPKASFITLPKGSEVKIRIVLPESINAPVAKGEIIGYAICEANGKEIYIIYLEATETVKEKKKSLINRLFGK